MANTLKFGNGQWATGNGTALAYNDENANFKPLPFDFTRASSGTTVNQSGLIETVGSGIPRIDFQGNTKGALLLEPSRTNSLLQSNQFDTSWSNLALTPLSSQIGVGGSTDAWLLNVTGNSGSIRQNVSQNGVQTLSVYAKKSVSNWIALYVASTVDPPYVYFDLDNGVVGTSFGDNTINENIESVGDGWYRCSITFDRTISSDTIRIFPSKSNGVLGSNGDSIYIQYAQLEVGSYPTSYIPTSGSAVTRVADSCSQTPPDGVIGQTEGTIYAEAKINGLKDSNTIVTLHNGSFSEYLVIAGNSSGNINAYIFAGGVQQAGILSGTIYAVDSIVKCAMAYKENDVAFYINGVLIGTDSSATMASTSFFDVGSISFGNYPLNGSVKQTKLYNTRLSNNELASLTTI